MRQGVQSTAAPVAVRAGVSCSMSNFRLPTSCTVDLKLKLYGVVNEGSFCVGHGALLSACGEEFLSGWLLHFFLRE